MRRQKDPAVTNTFVGFNSRSPRLKAVVDRDKSEMLGVPAANVFGTMQTYLAGTYVNNINLIGHTFQVIAMADAPFRQDSTWVGSAEDALGIEGNGAAELGGNLRAGGRAVQGVPLQPVSVGRYSRRDARWRHRRARRWRRWSGSRAPAARRLLLRMDRTSRYQQQLAGNAGALSFVLAVVFVTHLPRCAL